jgi:hypothetical protein
VPPPPPTPKLCCVRPGESGGPGSLIKYNLCAHPPNLSLPPPPSPPLFCLCVAPGEAGGPGSLIKYNPLSNLTSAETWNFLRVMGVPTNKLHASGYISIGCEPCTRPVLPNQHEREGRWWWEDSTGERRRHGSRVVDFRALHRLVGFKFNGRGGSVGLMDLL